MTSCKEALQAYMLYAKKKKKGIAQWRKIEPRRGAMTLKGYAQLLLFRDINKMINLLFYAL